MVSASSNKKARIKGTEIELEYAGIGNDSSLEVRYYHNGRAYWMPTEWVEFYEPQREEPAQRPEIDSSGGIWMKRNGGWSCVFDPEEPNNTGRMNWRWEPMQERMADSSDGCEGGIVRDLLDFIRLRADLAAAKLTVWLFEAMNRYDDALMAAYAELNEDDE